MNNQNFFLSKIILEKTSSIDETGQLVWQLVIALFISWLFVYFMVLNGIKVSGKLVYFTSIFPYVVLLILGIRGWTLPGAYEGIKYYIYPDLTRLKDYTVWTGKYFLTFFFFLNFKPCRRSSSAFFYTERCLWRAYCFKLLQHIPYQYYEVI